MNIKTLSDMARYLKSLLTEKIPGEYAINPLFNGIANDEHLRDGVLALREFMGQLYDLLITNSLQYEKPTVRADKNPSIAVDYPFIYHVKSVLLNIGYHGMLTGDALTFSGLKTLTPIICCEGMAAKTKISAPKLITCLRFLNDCGMYFEGFDLYADKIHIENEKLIEVTYPDNPGLLIGLKAMSVAQRTLRWKTKDEIFLRCDYRALTNDKKIPPVR